jgi:hypothetical protein
VTEYWPTERAGTLQTLKAKAKQYYSRSFKIFKRTCINAGS